MLLSSSTPCLVALAMCLLLSHHQTPVVRSMNQWTLKKESFLGGDILAIQAWLTRRTGGWPNT